MVIVSQVVLTFSQVVGNGYIPVILGYIPVILPSTGKRRKPRGTQHWFLRLTIYFIEASHVSLGLGGWSRTGPLTSPGHRMLKDSCWEARSGKEPVLRKFLAQGFCLIQEAFGRSLFLLFFTSVKWGEWATQVLSFLPTLHSVDSSWLNNPEF